MTMPTPTALTCPSCGAPLPTASSGTVLCLYCNTAIHIQTADPSGAAQPSVERSLGEAQMAHLKQLILEGKRVEAIAEVRSLLSSSEAEASITIDQLENSLSLNIVRRQQLSTFGWLLFIASLLIFSGTVYAFWSGRLNIWFAILLAFFSLANIAFYAGGVRTSLEFLGAPVVQATVLKVVPIGEVKMGRQMVHTFKVLLEVHPKKSPAYQAELFLPVRHKNLSRVRSGVELKVKIHRQDPQRLIYQD